MSGSIIIFIPLFLAAILIIVLCNELRKFKKNVNLIGELLVDETAFEGTIVQLSLDEGDVFKKLEDNDIVRLKIVKNVDLTEP